MSVLNYIVDKLKSGIITFINAVTLANRDYPYHDYMNTGNQGGVLSYVVGTNNINGKGGQSKLFVSKSTLIYASGNCTVQFNDANNVVIDIVGGVWYEFKSNIWQVFYDLGKDGVTIYFYFEGVLPQEARGPE